jgi:hypothetical protein
MPNIYTFEQFEMLRYEDIEQSMCLSYFFLVHCYFHLKKIWWDILIGIVRCVKVEQACNRPRLTQLLLCHDTENTMRYLGKVPETLSIA